MKLNLFLTVFFSFASSVALANGLHCVPLPGQIFWNPENEVTITRGADQAGKMFISFDQVFCYAPLTAEDGLPVSIDDSSVSCKKVGLTDYKILLRTIHLKQAATPTAPEKTFEKIMMVLAGRVNILFVCETFDTRISGHSAAADAPKGQSKNK